MTLSSCILITIPVCISAILMQTYFDSRKYKRIPHLIVLLSFLFPTLSHAQYIDNENCRISFKSYENHQGKLEYNKEGIIYQFIPNSNAWKVIIKNNTDETVWLNWKQAGFIVNGRASGISLYPFTTDEAPLETQSDKPRGSRGRAPSVIIILSADFRMASYQRRNYHGKECTSDI